MLPINHQKHIRDVWYPARHIKTDQHILPSSITNLRRESSHRIPTEPKTSSKTNPKFNDLELQILKGIGTGRKLLLMANGPSINQYDFREMLSDNTDTMAINHPIDYLWPTTYWLFCDRSQYARHPGLWDDVRVTVISNKQACPERENCFRYNAIGGLGFSMDVTNGIYVGKSSTYVAMQFALYMDYDRVDIYGHDMCGINDDGNEILHFYGTNPDVRPDIRKSRFDGEEKSFEYATKVLEPNQRRTFNFMSPYNNRPFTIAFGDAIESNTNE